MTEWMKIKHLYLRAGFGLNQDELLSKKSSKLKAEIRKILQLSEKGHRLDIPTEFKTLNESRMSGTMDKKDVTLKARKLLPLVNVAWVKRMATTPDPLLEKMTLFWHGHFACRSKMPHLATNQINTIRKHALGNFKDLVHAVVQDPSMILYLDNQRNSKQKPNENFARELMELFTIGIGHYTEEDVKEAGRALTGWRVNQLEGKAIFVQRRHDAGTKSFMGQTGRFGSEEIVDIILSKKETATFIATKIYAYFVNARINEKHVASIANTFYNGNYDIKEMMSHILQSDWFYDKENIGSKIKSPIELLVGMMKTLKMEFKIPQPLLAVQRVLGQILFNPPNVAGWQGDKDWINNATLINRLNMPMIFLMAGNIRNTGGKQKGKLFNALSNQKINIRHFSKQAKGKSDADVANLFLDDLLQIDLGTKKSVVSAAIRSKDEEGRVKALLYRVMSLPEYQMC